MQFHNIRRCFGVLLFILLSFSAFSQLPDDLSKFKAGMINDAQLRTYVEQATKAGLTEAEIEQEVRRRGLPEAEVAALRNRIRNMISAVQGSKPADQDGGVRGRETGPPVVTPPVKSVDSLRVFGSELFSTGSSSFEPDLRMPTPSNYKLGPDDQLVIDVFGINESQQTPKITPEGYIKLNYVGPVYVNGLTIEEARNRISAKLAQVYPAIRSGGTKLQISLGSIRSIRVTLLGAVVKPGTYTLPSLASLFNALYSSGGPDEFGSFRTIELIRKNKVVEKIDIYRFLLNGDQSQNVRLEDMDVIRIPVAPIRVQVAGEVKRPGIYELLPGETLANLLHEYSGGFRKTAATAIIRTERITEREKKLVDVAKNEIESFRPQDGDKFTVDRIIDRFENAVAIKGAVLRPGTFAFQAGMRISDLVAKAAGFKDDVYLDRALLYRLREDQTKEITAVNLREVMSNGQGNILVRKDDELVVNSLSDLTDEFPVLIGGAVRKPGSYTYRAGMTLKDVILVAGGVTEEAHLGNIELSRRKKYIDPNDPAAQLSEVMPFAMDTISLSINQQDFDIRPFDMISIKANPFRRAQEVVTIEGKVLYPGPYALKSRMERLSDVIRRAGNPLAEANISGAKLKRRKNGETAEKTAVEKMSFQARDSTGALPAAVDEPYDFIVLDLQQAIAEPGGEADIFLQDGDIITIPRQDPMVDVDGEVLHPVKINHQGGKKLRFYINAAGGFVGSANKNKVFVVYPNGKAAKTRKFLFFRNYPDVTAGSKIFVPKYIPEEKPKRSPAETMAIVSALATISYFLVSIVNQSK